MNFIRPLNAVPSNFSASKRFLGNAVRGQQTLKGHCDAVKGMFCGPPIVQHSAWIQKCESFRLLAFIGVFSVLTLDLIIDPPKASYWTRFNPFALPKRVKEIYFPSETTTPQ